MGLFGAQTEAVRCRTRPLGAKSNLSAERPRFAPKRASHAVRCGTLRCGAVWCCAAVSYTHLRAHETSAHL
eukprot:1083054-Alexandrium_andersonii.AAC.1